MKRLVLILAVVVVSIATISLSASPKQTTAGVAWPPLLSCPDLNGDGAVSALDLFALLGSAGSVYSPTSVTDYLYLYDTNGDQAITLLDFLNVLGRLGERCPLVDTQVAQATLATMQYRDCNAAISDGYGPGTGGVYVPNMGIHISKTSEMGNTFDPEQVFGLVCTETAQGSSVVDRLIGLWYILPVASTGPIYGVSGPYQDDNTQPLAFGTSNSDEDNFDPPGQQAGWHTHVNLCVGSGFLEELFAVPNANWHDPNDPVHECLVHRGGFILIPLYGWMLHLYNFIPNLDGRFMRWNTNLP